MLTGQTDEKSIEAALTAGANDDIGKPYSPLALLSVVDTLTGKGRGLIYGQPYTVKIGCSPKKAAQPSGFCYWFQILLI